MLIAIGINHFLKEMNFEKIVPPFIPFPEAAVYLSGAFEIFFGLGFLFEKTRRYAAIGWIVLLLAVFPANIYMYTSGLFPQYPDWLLLLRLAVQVLLIGLAVWIAHSPAHGEEVK
ncbi:MAG: DoxX family membrane protein [Chitinophagales bacterium]